MRGELLGCERWGGVRRSRGSGWGEVGGVVSILGRCHGVVAVVVCISRNFQRTRGSEKWILGASELRSLEESDLEFSDL